MRQDPSQDADRHFASGGLRVRTLVLVAAFLIFGFGLLTYQLYVLQLRDDDGFRVGAVEQQLYDEILPATRGSIYSANGRLLAKSNVMWNIVADPLAVTEEGAAYLDKACKDISELLDGQVTPEDLMAQFTAINPYTNQKYEYRVLARDLDMPTADAILAYADELRLPQRDSKGEVVLGEDGRPLAGARVLRLYREQTATRSYPYGEMMSSILGFCDSSGKGMYGLENSYNEELAGTAGRSVSTRSLYGYELSDSETNVHPAIDGQDLHLTIDETVQGIVEQYLKKAVEDFNVKNRGCAIVMEVKTGAILGMATVGQFDPNDPYRIYDEQLNAVLEGGVLDATAVDLLKSRLGEDEVKDIIADGAIDEEEYPTLQGMLREAQWKNKNLTELYYPGSVFKLVTASAALDSGLMDASQTFYCGPNGLTVNGGTRDEHTYHCAEGNAHGVLDMAGALNHSCNLYFIQVGQLINARTFYSYIDAFGFTKPTGIDLPNETRWMILHDADAMERTATNLYSAAFGQNMGITPLQMATAIAAITNGGYLITPYVVDSVTDTSGNVIRKTEPAIRRQVISEEVSAAIRGMMEDVVGHGDSEYHGGANAYVAGYRIGGKSGTAEQLYRGERYDGDYYKAISFSAVLPIDDPQIEVFVMLDDPRWNNDYASQLVAPVVGNIISEIAPYLGIDKDPTYTPEGSVTVSNCMGKSWTTAQVDLNKQGLSHQLIGSSGSITYQYPYGGQSVPAGSTIYLYTDATTGNFTTVPDVMGKTGSFAAQMLKAAGLNAQIEGDAEGRVVAQSLDAESSAEMGTVILITTEAPASGQPDAADEPAQQGDTGDNAPDADMPPESGEEEPAVG